MKYKTKKTLGIFYAHAKRYKLAYISALIFILIADTAFIRAQYILSEFFDTLAVAEDKTPLVRLIFNIFIFYMIHWVGLRLTIFIMTYAQTHAEEDLNQESFDVIHSHSIDFFENNFVGSLVKKVNRFSRAYLTISDRIIWDLYPAIINVSLTVGILMFQHVWLGIISLVWVIIYCICNYLFSRYKLKYDVERSQIDSKVTGFLADTVSNYKNIKFFAGFRREKKSFLSLTTKRRKLHALSWNLANVFDAIQVFLIILLEIVIMYVALILWERGILTLGDFVLIQALILRIFERLWSFGRTIRDMYEAFADAEEMTEIIDLPRDIKDAPDAKKLVAQKASITFDAVTFNYNKTRTILDNFSLDIAAGQKMAFVGPSGAGKSTIVKILLRAYDVTSGGVYINGHNIQKITQDSLHRLVTLVPQDPVLFHRTLLENIRYGKPTATKKEVIAAAKQAHCHEFISTFKEGYDTYVGERGVKLSGGERQRVAIARAILTNAPILVLDEATSSLDSESERLIQDALENFMKGKTVISIAHRLSTIMKMDRIIVLEGGKIKEEGTHSELLKKDGLYQHLWDVQVGGLI